MLLIRRTRIRSFHKAEEMYMQVAQSGNRARPNNRRPQATTTLLHTGTSSKSKRSRPRMSRELKPIFAMALQLCHGCKIQAHLLVLQHSRTTNVGRATPLYALHELVINSTDFRAEKTAYFTRLLDCSPVDLINHEAQARGELGQRHYIFERVSKALALTA